MTAANSGDTPDIARSTEPAKQCYADDIRKLRETIVKRGWRDSAEFVTNEIQFIADLASEGYLSFEEIQCYALRTQVTTDILIELRDGPYLEERRNVILAVQAFNEVLKSSFNETRLSPPPLRQPKVWSVSDAIAWRDHVDSTRQFCEDCCYSWPIHLNSIPMDQRSAALECVKEIRKRIPLLRSGRLADAVKQYETLDKCMILNFKVVAYLEDVPNFMQFAQAIVHSQKKWAALMEALNSSRWLDSREPRGYLNTVASIIYRRDVRPDIAGRDSQGFEHWAGPGGKVKSTDALRPECLTLEEIAETPNEAVLERRFTERSVMELQAAATQDADLKSYVDAVVKNPKRKRFDIWAELGWSKQRGEKSDRKYRRLRQRLKELGAGMEWREIPSPRSPSQTVYFEVLKDGAKGTGFGVYQHKPLKTGAK
jgi:hypothetical protein